MDAIKGLSTAFRSRGRLIGLCMASALVLAAHGAPTASARKPPKRIYVALGDSLAFGYSQESYNRLRVHENRKTHEAEPEIAIGFQHGYVNYYLRPLNEEAHELPESNPARALFSNASLRDFGCPRETSASLIGNGPVGEAMESLPEPATTEAPCAYETEWLQEKELWKETRENASGNGGPLHLNLYHDAPHVEFRSWKKGSEKSTTNRRTPMSPC